MPILIFNIIKMNKEEVEIFLKLQPQLKSTYEEISLLSKKKQTEEVNKFKLKFINSILLRANKILGDAYKPFPEEFEKFIEEDIPSNSDVVFILSHYLTSLEKLRCDNIIYNSYKRYWLNDWELSEQETDHPTIK